jgi:hypothetical protein
MIDRDSDPGNSGEVQPENSKHLPEHGGHSAIPRVELRRLHPCPAQNALSLRVSTPRLHRSQPSVLGPRGNGCAKDKIIIDHGSQHFLPSGP